MPPHLMDMYQRLYSVYGPQHWWPGEGPFEMMVGAILTQNTAWIQVEKSIRRLKARGMLNPRAIHRAERSLLASLIRPSGTFRIKADRLKAFVDFFLNAYGGSIARMKKESLTVLRQRLLAIRGIGPETADSMLLYGLGKPIFVVDAYTRRILSRHAIVSEDASYEEVQRLFMEHLPEDERLFNEYHALLVHLGKNACKKVPKCDICPLRGMTAER